jgi:hypothetical protein
MPSPFYTKLVTLVGEYVGPEKASGLVTRQITSQQMSPDTFNPAGYATIKVRIVTATGLYLTDPGRKKELADRLNALAA